jgi:hypothetical protein
MYRGLTPHKIIPMPGTHEGCQRGLQNRYALLQPVTTALTDKDIALSQVIE